MQKDNEKSHSEWLLMEIASMLKPADFQAYCDAHPEARRKARERLGPDIENCEKESPTP